jgi:acyl carrier protein
MAYVGGRAPFRTPAQEVSSMTDTLQRLVVILTREFKLAPERLGPDARLEDLGIDSLGAVELLWNIEEAFGIKLPSEPVELPTLGDVVRFVEVLVSQQGRRMATAVPVAAPASSTA